MLLTGLLQDMPMANVFELYFPIQSGGQKWSADLSDFAVKGGKNPTVGKYIRPMAPFVQQIRNKNKQPNFALKSLAKDRSFGQIFMGDHAQEDGIKAFPGYVHAHRAILDTTLSFDGWKHNTHTNDAKVARYALLSGIDIVTRRLDLLKNVSIWNLRVAILKVIKKYLPDYSFHDGYVEKPADDEDVMDTDPNADSSYQLRLVESNRIRDEVESAIKVMEAKVFKIAGFEMEGDEEDDKKKRKKNVLLDSISEPWIELKKVSDF